MKFTKTEKIWLAMVSIFYMAYNLPFFPSYDSPVGTIIHALLTLLPLWVCVYVGLVKVSSVYDRYSNTEQEDT